jgi:hypothetical protein
VKLGLIFREERRICVFENRVLRRIFVPKRNEVTGEQRRQHNEKLYTLYSSANIIRGEVTRMWWTKCVTYVGRGELVHTGLWWGILSEVGHLEDPGVDGRITLK